VAEEQINGVSPPEESGSEKALTPIPRRIHWGATPDAVEPEDELVNIAINNFLDTLAEIALAVARRKQELEQ